MFPSLPPRSSRSLPKPSRPSSARRWSLALAGLAALAGGALAQTPAVNYDIVYVRQPRFGDLQNTTWPEIFHPGRIDPGADLMLLHPDGSEEVLVDCTVCSVTDPMVDFQAQWVYYSLFHDVSVGQLNTQRDNLSRRGADIFRIHLQSRQVQQLTFGEFTPATGAGNFDETNPLDPPPQYNRLGYGILNLGPMPLPGGRIAFTSSRNGLLPTAPYTSPNLQLFVMDLDGSNPEAIAPMTLGSALHPTILRDGRLMFSSYESQGLRDRRIWGIWTIWPDGRNWGPLVSALTSPEAFHFMTQTSSGEVIVEAYYNLNNNGFGALYGLPPSPPAGQPAFHGAPLADNPQIPHTLSNAAQPGTFRFSFTPRGYRAITPLTHHQDHASPIDANGVRNGKFTHPSAAPGNDLLVVWSSGPANDLNRPTPVPYYDAGLYLIPGSQAVWSRGALVPIKNDPAYNEAWPRAVVPYSAIHGVAEPARLPRLANDGSVHPALPAGTPHGLVGSSSLYKRESAPGRGYPSFQGLDPFNTAENETWSNWAYQGADAGRYANSDIWGLRILAMEPNVDRRYGPGASLDGDYSSFANERLRVLGEFPVRKFTSGGQPILDTEGNPDTSFLIKLPGDTPFTFQTLDRNGMVLNMAQTWHQVRPGEMRVDCGGCHAHSQQPLAFEGTAASAPGYPIRDLGDVTPWLTQDASGQPQVQDLPGGVRDVEFLRDIRPLLQRSCVQCHNGTQNAGNLDLSVTGNVPACEGNAPPLPGDYRRLAADDCATFGHKPVIPNKVWRQTNASRYVRMFQSRRSLLVWKIFGARLDGWTNADHPTESVPGNAATMPAGAHTNNADLDYTGEIMPPPGSGVPPLSRDERILIARWIDLGAPISLAELRNRPGEGWFIDTLRPTLTLATPRPGLNSAPVTAIAFGAADANSGLDDASLSLRASFPVAGRAPGSELIDLAQALGDGRYLLSLAAPLPALDDARLELEVRDRQGNVHRLKRTFDTRGGDYLFDDGFESPQ